MSIVLCVLDGFGIGNRNQFNAISCASTKFLGSMMEEYPSALLSASGVDVGLMPGQIGNSEIGHLTMGGGRIIENDIIRLNKLINRLDSDLRFKSFVETVFSVGGKAHVIGLISDGGVHSYHTQIYGIIDSLLQFGIEPVLHVISDGRDVSPRSLNNYLSKNYLPFVKTVIGRFYAMDRDKRWERTAVAYDLIVNGVGDDYFSVLDYVNSQYSKGISDEFFLPAVIAGQHKINSEDGIIFANFRADRARQLSTFLTEKAKFSDIISLTQYSDLLPIKPLIEPIYIPNSLGKVISDNNLTQLRIAESEKYAHVTYFFNGRVEVPMKGEERILVDSPKVITYDLSPAMSAGKITDHLKDAIESQKFDFILVNYANADMLGHTGNMEMAVKSIEFLDECILKIVNLIKNTNNTLLITADHGNIELMYDEVNETSHTAHTLNPVPLVVLSPRKIKKVYNGNLYDIAPTVLSMMNLPVPDEMQGKNLVEFYIYLD